MCFNPAGLPKAKPTSIARHCLVALSFLLTCISVQARNFYISSSSGNDSYTSTQAQNQATPWRSIAKLNTYFNSITAGDNIYFKRGDVFYGSIVVTRSGDSGDPITISAYGTGAKPVITGLITLSSWSSVGGGIYQASAPSVKSTVNLVILNGIPQQVGRYPNHNTANNGYLTYEANSSVLGINTITDNQLSGTNWTGAEVVMRKQHYAMEKARINSQIGGIITYTPTPSINPLNTPRPNIVAGTNGFGYFIQRDARTLDQLGEWYFNSSSRNMQMYFGSNNPSSYNIRVSTFDTLINLGSQTNISVSNLVLEGPNTFGIYGVNSNNLTIESCDINFSGGKGILFFNNANVLIDGVNTNYCMNSAIDAVSRNRTNTIIRNCNVKNTAMIAGMGSFWDDNDYKGITVNVTSDAVIEYNSVVNTGYVGIQFQGNDIMINNNFVNYYNIVKDDGGGIYTYASQGSKSYVNRTIRDNIVLNGVGASEGTTSKIDVDGIFLDGVTMNVQVLNNSVAHVGVNGIYSNNSSNVNIRGNTCFDNGSCIGISRYSWGSVSNLSIKQNVLYPKLNTQDNFQYVNTGINVPVVSSIQTHMRNLGQIDSNYIATPKPAGYAYRYELVEGGPWTFASPMTFAEWKSFTNHDRASKLPPKAIDPNIDIDDQIRFEYNASIDDTTIALDAKYIGVDSTVYNGTITLEPYTSKILIKVGPITGGGGGGTLTALATTTPVNCFGGTTTVRVTATGGTGPYTGTGNFTVSAGKGSLRLSVSSPVAGNSTMLFGSVGAVTRTKNYKLRFSTLGTSSNGSFDVYLRRTDAPLTRLTPIQSKSFGTTRINHEFTFTAPTATDDASFLIDVDQSSGTTYFDNISFYELNSANSSIGNNLYSNGQFETNINGIGSSSPTNNHQVQRDTTSKITNTYLYTVTDRASNQSVTAITIVQPSSALRATATAGTITVNGGTTSVVVDATGGTAPYSGTGTFTVRAGTYNYTVRDGNNCAVVVSVRVTQPGASNPLSAAATAAEIGCFGNSTNVTVSASGGTAPYTGTGTFSVTAGVGTLRLTVSSPVAGNSTLLYSSIGAISSTKRYVLMFSTRGTSGNGSLNTYLRQTNSPYGTLTEVQSAVFGTARKDHEFLFTNPDTEDDASFLIDIDQVSGTTYIDNIAVFEADASGSPIGTNLFDNGQFESDIDGISSWSTTDNHTLRWDATSKISNIYYYTVRDRNSTTTVAAVAVSQPSSVLRATATAGTITVNGGTTTIVVNASGGTSPYTGTGTFTVRAGTYNYTIRDAKGCSVATTVTVTQPGTTTAALSANATAPGVNCFGNSTSVTVSATGGRSPYTGTGAFSASAGRGSLRLSVTSGIPGRSTFLYAPIGGISSAKNYVLLLSTLGTTDDGSLNAYLRETASPYRALTPVQSASFGTTRVDHEFLFSNPDTETDASFLLDIDQGSGTTYIDNVAIFEADSTGAPVGNNLFSDDGQFESDINGIVSWSGTGNHLLTWDGTSKISNTYYYTVTDQALNTSVAAVKIVQPASALRATATAGVISVFGGSTTVRVVGTGGTAPYTGTGTFSVRAGTYNYTIEDANGCSATTSVTISQPDEVPPATDLVARATAPAINCYGGTTRVTVTGSNGTAPYTGTGSYTVNAGTGSLEISIDDPSTRDSASTYIYATIGAVSSAKSYVLRFSTLGTTANGSLKACLRQTDSAWDLITPMQSSNFGTGRVDHEFIFTSPDNENAASFLIAVLQSSGTVYIDNIAFFEATPSGDLLSANLYGNGQFETANDIGSITTWSLADNHLPLWDRTGKINNTYYYAVEDATGTINTAGVTVIQPAQPLQIHLSAPAITNPGGTTTVTVTATGGTAPYTGTVNHVVTAGTYNYSVTDDNGCVSNDDITVTESAARSLVVPVTVAHNALNKPLDLATDKNLENKNNPLKISSYPIPAVTEFGLMVEGGSKEMVNIIVQAIDGRVLYKTKGNTNTKYVFGNNFVPGIYIVKVTQGISSQTIRVVKGKL